MEFRKNSLGEGSEDKVVYFWNNRNAKRKQSTSVMWWFKEFLDEVGKDNACLIMHTDPEDSAGADLAVSLHDLDAIGGEIMLSTTKYPAEQLAAIYNMADCTINIADAEGFGLSTLESLSCGTPIIANMTGGLQEQVTDGENTFGVAIEPSSKAIVGSQLVPYIYEDRISKEDFLAALRKIYNMTKEERKQLGTLGREHVLKNYSLEKYHKSWDKFFTELHDELGSWDTRKNYKSWEIKEI
jgi:glycosyltransferase involved in cell wall biosynthesis